MSPPHFRCESKQLWLLKESIVIYFKLGQCPKLMEIRPLFVRKKLEYFLFCFLHIIVTVSFWVSYEVWYNVLLVFSLPGGATMERTADSSGGESRSKRKK